MGTGISTPPPFLCRAQKEEKEEKERTKGKESLWLLEAPVRNMILQMHKSVLESANPRMDSECASGCPWSTARATAPYLRQPTPGVVKQDKSSGGSLDTTKSSGPQRVRMGGGERPIGAAKGKQPNTKALCQTPLPLPEQRPCQRNSRWCFRNCWDSSAALARAWGGGVMSWGALRTGVSGVLCALCPPPAHCSHSARHGKQKLLKA